MSRTANASPLWLCLHLPELALDALGPWPPGVRLPMLAWQAAQGGQRVAQVNGDARALGIVPGQRLASAQALAPQTLVLARSVEREAQHLQRLALALGRFTPHIVLTAPDVLLEIHASLRLFGGLRNLLCQAQALARPLGHLRLGLAATPLAARLLARRPHGRQRCITLASTRRQLLPLPLALLADVAGLDPAAGHLLHALGARTLADLAVLPRAGLARRGAAGWLDALDRATGQRPDPPHWFIPPERFTLRQELAWRAEDATTLEAAAAPLLAALCGWLALRWQAAQRLQLRLHHEHGARRSLPDNLVALELATPSREPAHLQLLLRERLQRLPLAAPVDALSLHLHTAVPLAGHATSLLPDQPADTAQTLLSLVDRLQARLGAHSVWQLAPQADARPERADQLLAPGTALRAVPTATPEATPTLPRPAWLLRQAQPLAVQQDQPLHQGRPLRLLGKPERIEHGWHDGHLVRRDYHAAWAADGTLWWVYRERTAAHATAEAPQRWFLHGVFG